MILPDPDQAITELLDSLRCNLVVSDGPKYVLKTFCWINSGEHGGHSMASIPSSSGNCLHTFATRDWALSCTRRNLHQCVVTMNLNILFNINTLIFYQIIFRSVKSCPVNSGPVRRWY
ncbi:hypothetical protein GOODEAATRI_028415 [Goodea atripinnis]|uniref:Uncharacterized protein n=1 Tax=Goodea atripinnis TaxID=208336 RepID=A0ABV0NEB7_9TELE